MLPNPRRSFWLLIILLLIIAAGSAYGQSNEAIQQTQQRINMLFAPSETLDSSQVYIANSGPSPVPFSLRPDTTAKWQSFELGADQGKMFKGAHYFRIVTRRADNTVRTASYRLNNMSRYSIYWNGDSWDLIEVTK